MSLQAVAEAQRVEGLTYTRGPWFGGQHVGVRQEEVSPGPPTQLAAPGEGSVRAGRLSIVHHRPLQMEAHSWGGGLAWLQTTSWKEMNFC